MRQIILLSLIFTGSTALAAEKPTYEKDIAPIFQKKCVSCHNAANQKGELDLSTPFA